MSSEMRVLNVGKTGIKTISKEFTLFMDADGSHNPKLIPKIIEEINDNGICIASRYCDGGKTNDKVKLPNSIE